MSVTERLGGAQRVGYALFLAAVCPGLVAALHGQPAADAAVLTANGETAMDLLTAASIGTAIAVGLRAGPFGFLGAVLEFAGTSSFLVGGTGAPYAVAGFLLVFGGGVTWSGGWRDLLVPEKPGADDEDDEEEEEEETPEDESPPVASGVGSR